MRRKLYATLFVLAALFLVSAASGVSGGAVEAAVSSVFNDGQIGSPDGGVSATSQGTQDGTTLQCAGIEGDCSLIPR